MKTLPYTPTVEYSDFFGDRTKVKTIWQDRKFYALDSTGICQESVKIFCMDDCRYAYFLFRDNGIRDISEINFSVVIDDNKEEFCLPPCSSFIRYINDHQFYIRLSHLLHKKYNRVYLYVNWIRYRCENKRSPALDKVYINSSFTQPSAKERKELKEISEARAKYIMESDGSIALYKSHFSEKVQSKAWEFYPILRKQFSAIPQLICELKEYTKALPPIKQAHQEVICPVEVPINCYFDKGFYSTLFFVENCVPIKKCLSSGHSAVQYTVLVDQSQLEVLMVLYYLTIEKRRYFQYMNKEQRYLQEYLLVHHPAMKLKKSLDLIDSEYGNTPIVENAAPILDAKETLKKYFDYLEDIRTSTYRRLEKMGRTHGKWVSEYKLYTLVKYLFPDAIYQYSAVWLEHQILDIYIPSFKVAIEYQGEQHYVPSDYFGGEERYQIQRKLDKEKRDRCNANCVTLVEWHHSRPINMNQIIEFLCSYIPQNEFSSEHFDNNEIIPDISTMKELFFK